MSSAIFEVDASGFNEWVDRSIAGVQAMKDVLLASAQLVEFNTYPLVPFLTGRLQSSFHESINVTYPFFEVELGYMVVGVPFDYALIQHEEDFVHPRQGVQFYLKRGWENSKGEIMVSIEKDYLSALGV